LDIAFCIKVGVTRRLAKQL